MRKLLLAFTLFSLTFNLLRASAPGYTTQIDIQRGEKWWGLFTHNAPDEPFSEPFTVTTGRGPAAIPVMVSSNGRYIWSSQPFTVEFDGNKFIINSEHEKVQAQKGGKTLREAYLVCCHKNFPPAGSVPDSELYSMPVYETRIDVGFMQDQQAILDYAARLLEEGFPAGIIVIPEGWNLNEGLLEVDRSLYPDPAAMVRKLHDMGFRVMLTVTPYVAAYGKGYIAEINKGHLLRGADGSPLVARTAGGFSACYDTSHDLGAARVRSAMDRLREQFPADGFRLDCRGAVQACHQAGISPVDYLSGWFSLGESEGFHEYMPGGYDQLSGRAIALEYRPGRDEQRILNDIVSAGLVGVRYSGFVFPVSDTAAVFRSEATAYTALRLGLSTPVARVEFAPWRIADPKLYEQMKEAVKFRASAGHYVAEMVAESAKTAEPFVRHMEYQFPNNGFADCNDQFMIGSRYMFAPSLDDSPRRMVRLPRGTWHDRNGNRLKGPLVMEVDCSDGSLIYYELVSK